MKSIFKREIKHFFESAIGMMVVGVFLLTSSLFLFVFPDTSILSSPYVSLDIFFDLAPSLFIFLIPAITMRSIAEERQEGTLEVLLTQPIQPFDLIVGKWLASWTLVLIALFPTIAYYFTLYQLGDPIGNIDSGAIAGSYLGLLLLAGAYSSIGVFASTLADNQIVAFIIGAFLAFLFFYGFFYFSLLPIVVGRLDELIQMIGMDYHYRSISRGVVDLRDVLYFFSTISFFVFAAVIMVEKRKQ